MKKYKYIIFDFNGTIIDDVKLCLDILNKMLLANGQKAIDKETYQHVFTFPIKKYYEKAGFNFSKVSFEELAIEFIKEYQEASLKCSLYPKVKETLAYLVSKGYKLFVLSASEINNLKQQLDHFELSKYFTDVLGLSDIHATNKVELGLRLLQDIKAFETLLIGDTLHDKEVADKMGVDCYLVSCGHQHFDILNINGNKVINNISELCEALG